MLITSPANARVKAAAKLRDRKGRDEQGRIVIDGIREIARALDGGVQILELFVCSERLDDGASRLIPRAVAAGAQRIDVTPPVMEKLAFGQRVAGILAVAQAPRHSLLEMGQVFSLSARGEGEVANQSHRSLVAVLEGVEKPGNVGAVVRTADAAGVGGLIVADGGTDLYNPNAIRASLGAIFTLTVCTASTAETLKCLRSGGWQIVAARVDGAKPYTEVDFRRPTAIALGSEAGGLSGQWQGDDVIPISIPMLGHVDSLNVSATAAVLFYEALRQRG